MCFLDMSEMGSCSVLTSRAVKRVKANSHVACRAVLLRVYIVSFPFDLHSVAVFDSRLPCHAHAALRPCRSESDFSRQQHSMAVN